MLKQLVLVSALGLISTAQAQVRPQFMPETGVYSDPMRTGEGAFIEVQGNTMALAFFTHTPDGDSTFYTGAGPLFLSNVADASQNGFLPVTRATADLYKTAGGPVLGALLTNPAQPGYTVTKVGRVTVEFGYLNSVVFYLEHDTSVIPSPVAPPYSTFYMQRLTYGLATHGTDLITRYWCWPDFVGEWVFVDRADSSRTPLRLNFTERTITPDAPLTCPAEGTQQILSFRDPQRNAEMRCVYAVPDPLDGVNKSACELRLDGNPQPEIWISRSDMTATRVIGSRGAYRPGYARTTETVVGIRIQ